MTITEIVNVLNTIQNERNEFINIPINCYGNVSIISYNHIFLYFTDKKLNLISRNGHTFWVNDIDTERTIELIKMLFE